MNVQQAWRRLKGDSPGKRFQHFHEWRQQQRRSPLSRIAVIGAGLALVAVGVLMLFIPGPGLLVGALGAACLACESRQLARALDWLEVRGRRVATWCAGVWPRKAHH